MVLPVMKIRTDIQRADCTLTNTRKCAQKNYGILPANHPPPAPPNALIQPLLPALESATAPDSVDKLNIPVRTIIPPFPGSQKVHPSDVGRAVDLLSNLVRGWRLGPLPGRI
jgi:hypothetical protein